MKTVLVCGIPCSGKTTFCRYLKTKPFFWNWIHIDADDVRSTVCRDLGFSDLDRMKNLENAAYICNVLNKNKVNVLLSFVAPRVWYRERMREIVSRYGKFYVVWLKCSLEKAQARDTRGVYKRPLTFQFERPRQALVLDTSSFDFNNFYSRLLEYLDTPRKDFKDENELVIRLAI